MHKSATKCNETICKWCKNKHGASKIIDTFETYQAAPGGDTEILSSDVAAGEREIVKYSPLFFELLPWYKSEAQGTVSPITEGD
jgi:hypothetical protein